MSSSWKWTTLLPSEAGILPNSLSGLSNGLDIPESLLSDLWLPPTGDASWYKATEDERLGLRSRCGDVGRSEHELLRTRD